MLEVKGLTKRFGGIAALDGVDFRAAPGRVHALLGENGAGKSTLLKCLSGVHAPEQGEMRLDGRSYAPRSPREAEDAGMRFVHQELNLVPSFTACENAFVGRSYPRRWGLVDWRAIRARMKSVRDAYGLDLDLDTPVGSLSTAKCQLAEILRALMDEARVLVLDEPTASLSEAEAATLREAIARLAARGTTVILVSHRLDEVFAAAQDFTVLRNGRTVARGRLADTSRDRLVELMAGEAVASRHGSDPVATAAGEPMLELADFRVSPLRPRLDLTVGAGEIVGLYGVIGSGRSSLLRSIWGANPLARGTIRLGGAAISTSGIAERIERGCAYAPEDRRTSGLIMHHSVLDNAVLPRLSDHRIGGLPLLSRRRMASGARAMLANVGVKYRRLGDRISTLSGGNQQKVMLGRWLHPGTSLLLLDEPTRGVDVRSKGELHALCRSLAGNGAAVLFATSDIEELLMLATRVVVMAHGAITLDAANGELGRQAVLDATFREQAETGGRGPA